MLLRGQRDGSHVERLSHVKRAGDARYGAGRGRGRTTLGRKKSPVTPASRSTFDPVSTAITSTASTVTPPSPDGITLGFIGMADATNAALARAFEDEVLTVLARHGARVLFRGHRGVGEADTLPAEFHVIWFPHDDALQAYLSDPRRADIIDLHGDVFSMKTSVRLDRIE